MLFDLCPREVVLPPNLKGEFPFNTAGLAYPVEKTFLFRIELDANATDSR
jgi:hypothetical protein